MLKRNKLLLFVIWLILLKPSLASIYHFEVQSELYEKEAIVKYTAIFLSNENERIVKIYPGEFEKIKKIDEKCKESEQMIECKIPKGERVEISFETFKKIEKQGDKYVFEENLRISDNVESVVFVVKLPEGALLPKNGTKYMPSTAIVGSDGRRIIIAWEKKNVSAGEITGIKVFYEFLKTNSNEMQIQLLYLIVIAIAFAGFGGMSYYFFIYRKKALREMLIPLLRDDEKKIMEIILKYPKGVNQKVIVRESNYSKAKVSKVLKSLSERGLVKLERMGRTNKVYPITKIENLEEISKS